MHGQREHTVQLAATVVRNHNSISTKRTASRASSGSRIPLITIGHPRNRGSTQGLSMRWTDRSYPQPADVIFQSGRFAEVSRDIPKSCGRPFRPTSHAHCGCVTPANSGALPRSGRSSQNAHHITRSRCRHIHGENQRRTTRGFARSSALRIKPRSRST